MDADSIRDRLLRMYFAIQNTIKDPATQAEAGEFGYGPTKMAEGMDVYTSARNGVNDRWTAWVDGVRSTQRMERQRDSFEDAYQRLSTIAEAVLKKVDPTIIIDLGIHEPMPRGIADLLEAGERLFKGLAKPNVAAVMSQYGYTSEKVEQERAHFVNFREARGDQQATRDAAKKATKRQNQLLGEMDDWYEQYRLVMSVALGNQPAKLTAFQQKIAEVDDADPEVAQVTQVVAKPDEADLPDDDEDEDKD